MARHAHSLKCKTQGIAVMSARGWGPRSCSAIAGQSACRLLPDPCRHLWHFEVWAGSHGAAARVAVANHFITECNISPGQQVQQAQAQCSHTGATGPSTDPGSSAGLP